MGTPIPTTKLEKIMSKNNLYHYKIKNTSTSYKKSLNIVLTANKTNNPQHSKNSSSDKINEENSPDESTNHENTTKLDDLRGFNLARTENNYIAEIYEEILLIEWPDTRSVFEQVLRVNLIIIIFTVFLLAVDTTMD